MRLRYFAAGLAAFVLCGFGIPGPQGSGGGSGTAGASFTADPLVLDDGAGNVTYLSQGGSDGVLYVGNADGARQGTVWARNFGCDLNDWALSGTIGLSLANDNTVNWSSNTNYTGSKDLYLRRSAASTLTVDSDGAGGNASLVTGSFVSRLADWQLIQASGLELASDNVVKWSSTTSAGGSKDTYLTRAEANVLRLDGDGSAGTAAKLAVSGVAPMTSGQTLVLYDEGGDAALTVGTSGLLTAHTAIQSNGYLLSIDGAEVYYGSGFDIFEQGELTSITADGSAQEVLAITSADGDAGSLTLVYTILVSDGTDSIVEHGQVQIATIDTSGGVVAATPGETSVQVPSNGVDSATTSWTVTTTDDQDLEVNVAVSVTGFTPSSCTVRWQAVGVTGDVTLTVP